MVRSILIWALIALTATAVVLALHLPERMGCGGGTGRYVHCQHGLLSPEAWQRR